MTSKLFSFKLSTLLEAVVNPEEAGRRSEGRQDVRLKYLNNHWMEKRSTDIHG